MQLNPRVRASLELLGVEPTAGPAELKKAYHRLALLYHPDRNARPEAATEFAKVTEAYELLADTDRVRELNRKALRASLHRKVIEGLEITFGAFFGYRTFNPMGQAGRPVVARLVGKVDPEAADGRKGGEPGERQAEWGIVEENDSILDHAAYDALETVYAGRHSEQDEERLKGEVEEQRLGKLPWVVLNNQGILRFLDGDIRGAEKCYRELSERIPGNIVFMYRLGICLILEGFAKPRRTLLGALKPDAIKVEKGIALLKHCIKIGTERPVGRQKCLVIRKTLADVLEKMGRRREARNVWRGIRHDDPTSAEAAFKTGDESEALKILKNKSKPKHKLGVELRNSEPGALPPGTSQNETP